MPIVVSYDDVEAMGALAAAAGAGFGRAAATDRDLAFNADQQRLRSQQHLAALQMRHDAEQAQLDRQFRADLAGGEMAQRERLTQAELAGALERDRLGVQRDQYEHGQTLDRDQLRHQQRLEQIATAAALKPKKAGDGGEPDVTPGGTPSKKYSASLVQRFGHLVPLNVRPGQDRAEAIDAAQKEAAALAGLPTEQLQEFARANPDDPWAPYIQAVAAARPTGGTGVSPVSDPGVPWRPASGGALTSGQGLGDPLRGLTDEQLRQLAENPEQLRGLVDPDAMQRHDGMRRYAPR